MRQLAAAFASLVPLAAASLASGAPDVVRAEAAISGSGTTYRWTVRNTGDEPLRCVGLLLDGVQPTGATGPAGVLTRVGAFQGRGLVHMQAQANDVVAPGATVVVEFTTNVPIPPNAGGEIRYSSTCAPGSDVIGRATGPPPPPPPPAPRPCVCESIETRLTNVRRAAFTTGVGFRYILTWRMRCSAGSGRCSGKLTPVPPRRFRFRTEGGVELDCGARCGGTATGGPLLYFAAVGEEAMERPIRLPVDIECRRKTRRVFTIVFRKTGANVDRARSDLDGNGVLDGRQ
jgi:hypothetical protein